MTPLHMNCEHLQCAALVVRRLKEVNDELGDMCSYGRFWFQGSLMFEDEKVGDAIFEDEGSVVYLARQP